MPKMTFLDRLNSSEFDFTKNLSGSKMIKFPQSQALAALTSHFESLCSIVRVFSLVLGFKWVLNVLIALCRYCLVPEPMPILDCSIL